MTSSYDSATTALVLVDPYNDFYAEDGKIYPGLREVAEAVGLHEHTRERIILAGLTAPGCVEGTGRWAMELGYGVTLVRDATAAPTLEHLHAATELNGPLHAEVQSTADVVAGIKD